MIYWVRRLPPLLQHGIALALPLVLVYIIWLVLVAPVIELFQDSKATAAQLSTRILWDKELIGSAPQIRADMVKLQLATPASTGAIQSDSDVNAVASLQTQVQNFITHDGGDIQSVQPLPSVPEGGFDSVSIEVNFMLPLRTFPALLQQVETNTPDMFITTAAIRSADNSTANNGTGFGNQELSINWTVVAYRRIGKM